MKKVLFFLLGAFVLCSCDSLMMPSTMKKQGTLQISFMENFERTKGSTPAFPDTNEFILSVTNSGGASIYYGKYSAAPSTLLVGEGTYTISAKSCEFSEPKFDLPQYGDTQVAVVKSGQTSQVVLNCSMINAGMRLRPSADFLSDYPNAVLYLKSGAGRLMYGYSEKRTAYFLPGTVTLILSEGGTETMLFSRTLSAQQVLTVDISVASTSTPRNKSGITIAVDTTKTYLSDSYTLGAPSTDKGSSRDKAYSVPQARDAAPEQEVWVYGFIVGGDLSSSRCSFQEPFSSRNNLVLCSKSTCSDRDICLSVQLPSGPVRDALNLVDHPDNLGKKVFLKGDLVMSYYGLPGIQCITEYSF